MPSLHNLRSQSPAQSPVANPQTSTTTSRSPMRLRGTTLPSPARQQQHGFATPVSSKKRPNASAKEIPETPPAKKRRCNNPLPILCELFPLLLPHRPKSARAGCCACCSPPFAHAVTQSRETVLASLQGLTHAAFCSVTHADLRGLWGGLPCPLCGPQKSAKG